jgi:hypothetical protein
MTVEIPSLPGAVRFKRENMLPNFSVVCEVGLGYRGSGAAEGSVYSAGDDLGVHIILLLPELALCKTVKIGSEMSLYSGDLKSLNLPIHHFSYLSSTV